MMKGIYEFFWDCGRMGEVGGTFIADSNLVDKAIGKQVYFGEILGKHSEVYGKLDESDLVLKTQDQGFIAKFEDIMGEGYSTSYNPLDYIETDEEEDE
jgi:hypothetical protein